MSAGFDGIRRRVDEERYTIRFTPRRPGSVWSLINVRKIEMLTREGRMRPAGVRAFAAKRADGSGIYSFEDRNGAKLTAAEMRRFKTDKAAWAFFEAQPPGYRKTAIFYVISAKKPETRAKRLDRLVADSAAGLRIGLLRR
ncbi:MAG: YdeI/OmpD-associated family protein [Vicinamibacterales bacterium]